MKYRSNALQPKKGSQTGKNILAGVFAAVAGLGIVGYIADPLDLRGSSATPGDSVSCTNDAGKETYHQAFTGQAEIVIGGGGASLELGADNHAHLVLKQSVRDKSTGAEYGLPDNGDCKITRTMRLF